MMAFCRSFLCVVSTTPKQHAVEVITKNGGVRNGYKLLHRRFFKSQMKWDAKWKNKKHVASNSIDIAVENLENNEIKMTRLWKPFVFTLCFSAGSVVGCAIWEYEKMRQKAMSFFRGSNIWIPDQFTWRQKKRFSWRDEIYKKWYSLTEAEKWFYPICLANVLVFLAWRVPYLQSTMVRYFCSNPKSSVLISNIAATGQAAFLHFLPYFKGALCWPLVFTTFSHFNVVHLLLNMYALNSFSTSGIMSLGKEQFMCLYLAGGVISSFSSLFFRMLTKKPDLSLGASGAIMAIIGYSCTKFPHMELSLIAIPSFTFMAGNAIKALILFDLTGLILGWKFLDHAAHLGGVFTGIFWCYWGSPYIWQKREHVLQWWKKFRDTVK